MWFFYVFFKTKGSYVITVTHADISHVQPNWLIINTFVSVSVHVYYTGILTKPDLVDKGTEETVVDIVHNEVIPLKKGYMIVRCRGQKEIMEKVSLSEATEREKAFFKDHVHLR